MSRPRKTAPDRPGGDTGALGPWGEEFVAEELRARGYQIVARNATIAGVELDIVARRRRTVILVEVKTCRAPLWPESLLSSTQRGRLLAAVPALRQTLAASAGQVHLLLAALRVTGEAADLRFFRLSALGPAGPG